MRPRHFAVLLALLGGVFGVFLSAAPAAVAGDASFALRPVKYDPKVPATKSYFIIQLHRGQTIRSQVTVVNAGATAGTAYLYPVDATTGQTSGAVYLSRTSPRRDVGAWITLDASSITLAPGERKVVGFSVHVPRTLRPGDHLGGIVAENARLTVGAGHSQLQIKIQHLTIVAVEAKIPGRAVRAMAIGRVKAGGGAGYQRVFVSLRNAGTVMLKPEASLLLTDSSGQTVAQRTFQLDTFLPQTSIDYPMLIPGQALAPGSYRTSVTLSFAGESITHAQAFTVSNGQYTQVFAGAPALVRPSHASPLGLLPWIIAGLVVLLALGAFAYRRWAYYW